MKKLIAIGVLLTIIPTLSHSSDLVHTFGSPSFSGIGQSQHFLSIAQIEHNRKQKLKDDAVIKIEISKNFYDLIKASLYYVFTLEKDEAKKEEILRKSITQEIYTPLNEYELTFKTLIHIIAEIERVAA